MRCFLLRALISGAVLIPLAAHAQIITPSMLTAAGSVYLTDILGLEQGSTGPGTGAPRKATIQQIADAITGASFTYSALQTFSGGASITGLALGLTAHGVLIAEGAGNVIATAAPTAGQLLVGQGASADPLPRTISGDGALSSAGVLTISAMNGGTPFGTMAAENIGVSCAGGTVNPITLTVTNGKITAC